MDYRSVTSEQFAFNHPAGRLGKRLTLKVADVMHQGEELPLLPPEASFVEVVTAISRGGLGAVPIVEEDGRLSGLVTDGDLRRLLEQTSPTKLDQITAAEFMTPQPIAVDGELLAYDALHLMENRPSQISVLPVVDAAHRCLGLVRIHDLIRSGI
nr:CBS domain-containing protein [Synechococcus elongatus]